MNKKILLISASVVAGVFLINMVFNVAEKTTRNADVLEAQHKQRLIEDDEFVESGSIAEAAEDKIADEGGFSEKSKFNERCLNVIKKADQGVDIDNITVTDQRNMSDMFNSCIYEIDMELALIERQFNRTAENLNCLNRAYEVRDYLLELGVSAQRFSDMPNNTDSDRVQISEIYSQVLADIFRNGQLAMDVRATVCLRGS